MYIYTCTSHFCRSFLRLGDPLCCTINDITIDQLEREANTIAPITNPSNPSSDKQTNPDSEPEKQESSTSSTKEHNQPMDTSNSASTSVLNGVTENEQDSDKKTETDDIVVNQKVKYGGSLSLARIQSLVSMTTPRSGSLTNVLGSPSFIEIDHSIDGFGCLFLPSVFPQAINASQQLQGKTGRSMYIYTCTCTCTYIHVYTCT